MIRHLSAAWGLSRRAGSLLAVTLALASASPVTSSASTSTAPAAPARLCVEQTPDCGVVAGSRPGAKKWHPGHYMQNDFNATQKQRFSYYDAIASNKNIAGVAFMVKWSQLEGAQGDYSTGIALIGATLSKLKSLPTPKRLLIRMTPQYYGSVPGGGCSYYPDYVVSMGGCGAITSGSYAAFWNPAVTDRYIALMQALAKAFDSDPNFEGIMPIRETSAAPLDGNWNWGAMDTQLRRIALASSKAFVKSNVIFFANGMAGQSRVDSFIAYLNSIQVGAGSPDTCSLEHCKTRMPNISTLMGLSGGVDYRGKLPIIWSVEASELGLNRVGPNGGYTAQQVYDIVNNTMHASHMLWLRQMYAGTNSQKWDPGMLAVINKSPLTHTACPEIYTQGCDTN